MTNEERQLLLKDLCARLPYGVIVQIQGRYDDGEEYIRETEFDSPMFGYLYDDEKTIIPYLRPMSSMTQDEELECINQYYRDYVVKTTPVENNEWKPGCETLAFYHHIDWLNEHHFDYRGLIEKGLALEAPEDMYK